MRVFEVDRFYPAVFFLFFPSILLAGKINTELSAELLYPNVIPPVYQIGGFNDEEVAEELTSIEDISYIDEDFLIVSESGGHRLLLMSSAGEIIRHSGGFGKKSCQFNTPKGVYLHGDLLYVVDAGNKRIQILNATNLSCQSMFSIPEVA